MRNKMVVMTELEIYRRNLGRALDELADLSYEEEFDMYQRPSIYRRKVAAGYYEESYRHADRRVDEARTMVAKLEDELAKLRVA